jgi:hypothetical protein
MIGAWVLRLLAASQADAEATTRATSPAAPTGGSVRRCGIGDGIAVARSGRDTRAWMLRSRWASVPAADTTGLVGVVKAAAAGRGTRCSAPRAWLVRKSGGRSAVTRARACFRTARGAGRRAGTAARRGATLWARGCEGRTTMSDPPESERGCAAGAATEGSAAG